MAADRKGKFSKDNRNVSPGDRRGEGRYESRNDRRGEGRKENEGEAWNKNVNRSRNENPVDRRGEGRYESRNDRRGEGRNKNEGRKIAYKGEKANKRDFKSESIDRSEKLRDSLKNEFMKPDIEGFHEEQDLLEGRNSVLEALRSGRSINRIFVAKGDREGSINQIIAMARERHTIIQEVDRSKLDAMSQTFAHQGVIALVAAKDYVDVDDILKAAQESGRPPFIIILDEITDAHNLGSILRTANAAGVHGVIIPKRRAIGLTSTVSKASAGAVEYVPVARVTNIAQTIKNLKKQNIWVVGTDATGEKAYFDNDLSGPIALVIGSEGEGMGKLIRESCDFVVNIPMLGQISSLNAAVAGAIVTFEILRQRSNKQP
jgi:23S rRNA (guanosine2251-2'-O)-methyltransferase